MNIKHIKIIFITFFAFTLAGCAQLGLFLHSGKLPVETANEIHAKVGEDFNFGHLVILDARTGESKLLKRTEILEDGKPRYTTELITKAQTVKRVKNISSYSAFGAEIVEKNGPNDPPHCNDIGHSFCNIVTINNRTEIICRENETIVSGMLDKGRNYLVEADQIFQETSIRIINSIKEITEIPVEISKRFTEDFVVIPKIITLPNQLVKKLEALGGGKVNEIGFLVIQDLKTGEMKLVKNEGYKRVNNNLLDCVGKLTSVHSETSIVYDGSCCSVTGDLRNCDRRC